MEDYTVIKDDRIRAKICKLMSEMLDDPDEQGIYQTARFMSKMETFVLFENKRLKTENSGLKKEHSELLELTTLIEKHPEDYEGPCLCKLCMSYA